MFRIVFERCWKHRNLLLFAGLGSFAQFVVDVLQTRTEQASRPNLPILVVLIDLGLFCFAAGGLIHNGYLALTNRSTSILTGWAACRQNFPKAAQIVALLTASVIGLAITGLIIPVKGLLAYCIGLPIIGAILFALIEYEWILIAIVVDELSVINSIKHIWYLTRSEPIRILGLGVIYLITVIVGGNVEQMILGYVFPTGANLRVPWAIARWFTDTLLLAAMNLWLISSYLNIRKISDAVLV